MSNFSILKRLARGKTEPYDLSQAEPYAFPDAESLELEPPAPAPEPMSAAAPPEERPEEKEAPPPRTETPFDFAKIEADMILRDARQQAEELLEQARQDARQQAEEIRRQAEAEGERTGYAEGLSRAMQEAQEQREAQAAEMQEQVAQFLERATASLDGLMDQSAADLRDLAIAIAEKIVRVSLKSSGEVIGRMIQSAIEKHKRQEWVHIYIADCDAKRMAQIPKQLAAALSALSGRVRIIPMVDDESGICIVEMPDEIIDASVSTQIANIRSALASAPASDSEIDFQLMTF